MPELPRKDFYKLSEVCHYTDTQPYVLRFWESEFPQLEPEQSASGQRLYRMKDIEVVCRIKQLLYDEEYTLEAAREQLATEISGGTLPKRRRRAAPSARPAAGNGRPQSDTTSPDAVTRRRVVEAASLSTPVDDTETVPRQRYEDAVDEVDHLRMALKEAERNLRRAEAAADTAREQAAIERERAERAIAHLERLHEILS